jgi:class 3 adenylate cyclase
LRLRLEDDAVEPQRVERKLAAILAADVAGYSRLMEADEEGTLARLKSLRRELIDPKINEHHGRIVKTTGDGALVEFPSVVEAVRCAVEVQHGMAGLNADVPKDRRIEFRIGINLGDIIVDPDDIHGDGVNVAARLQQLAHPGGIAVSRTVVDHVKHKLALRSVSLGEQRLKNITEPVEVYRIRLEPSETAIAPWWQRRARLVAGATFLILIGVAGTAYIQHRASLTETTTIPSGPNSEAEGATTPPEIPKETPTIPPGPKSEAQGAITATERPKEMPPLDAQVWEAIRNSTNPADFEAYLRIFPSGAIADLARERLNALAPAPHPPANTTEPTSAAREPTPDQKAIATESTPSSVPAPQPSASTDAPAMTMPIPVPQQKTIATRSAPPPVPAPQPRASTTGPTSAALPPTPHQKVIASRPAPPTAPAPQPPDHTDAPTTTVPTPVPQQQASAAPPTTAAAPAAAPQQQALIAPDVSKSVTSPTLPGAPYDGEWKGFVLGSRNWTGGCQGHIKVMIAKNLASAKMECIRGSAQLSGTIASDGSFTGKLASADVSGKFDGDRFQGIISVSTGGVLSSDNNQAIFLERVK